MDGTEDKRVLRLPAAEIRPNPRQPRQVFDEAALRELAASIRRHGILQPLTVRRRHDGWELVAGERRLRAARLVGMETVPCIEADVDDRESALLALVENLQRQDLHYFEEAAAIADYLRRSGSTQEEAAAQLGRSPSAVANKLRPLSGASGLPGADGAARSRPAASGRRRGTSRRRPSHCRTAFERGPVGAIHRTAAYRPSNNAACRTPYFHHQGCPAPPQQHRPGRPYCAGGRDRRPMLPGGHGRRHFPHNPDSPQENKRKNRALIMDTVPSWNTASCPISNIRFYRNHFFPIVTTL